MVGSTRGTPSGFGAGGNGDPPPPPPPVGIAEVLAAQTEILRLLVQAQRQRGVGIILTMHKKWATKISLVLSLHCSLKWMSLWTQTLGFAQSSPSFLYWLLLVQKRTRLAMPRSSFADQLVCGGIITTDCYRLIMWWIGMSSKQFFELIQSKFNEFLALTQGTRTVL